MTSCGTLLCLQLFAASGFAQQSINFGTLRRVEGFQRSRHGAGPFDHEPDRNQGSVSETDGAGRFSFAYLPAGLYEVRIEHPGFQPFVRKVNLSIGQGLDLPVVLSVSGLNQAIDVSVDDVPVLDTLRTQAAATIRTDEIHALPLNGRNYLDLAALVPAVSKTNTGNNERLPRPCVRELESPAGQRNLVTTFVDGLSANDDVADLAWTFFSQEVIRELQVVRSGGIAEFGRSYSGFVNVSTRSGTCDWHGDAMGSFAIVRCDECPLGGSHIGKAHPHAADTRTWRNVEARYGPIERSSLPT
jgi:hypothetical protein